MHADTVTFYLLAAFETLRTVGTGVRPVGSVGDPNVRLKGTGQFEQLATFLATVSRLRRTAALTVHWGDVIAQYRLQLEAETALTADVWSGIWMCPFVVIARRRLPESLRAARMTARVRTLTGVRHRVRRQQLTQAKLATAHSAHETDTRVGFPLVGCGAAADAVGSAIGWTGDAVRPLQVSSESTVRRESLTAYAANGVRVAEINEVITFRKCGSTGFSRRVATAGFVWL
jgi:hypothetical protein